MGRVAGTPGRSGADAGAALRGRGEAGALGAPPVVEVTGADPADASRFAPPLALGGAIGRAGATGEWVDGAMLGELALPVNPPAGEVPSVVEPGTAGDGVAIGRGAGMALGVAGCAIVCAGVALTGTAGRD